VYLANPTANEEKVRNVNIISAFFNRDSFMSFTALTLFNVPSSSLIKSLSTFVPSLYEPERF